MKFLVATVFGIGLAVNSLGLPQSSTNQDPHHHLSKRIIGGGVAPAGKYKFASIVKRFTSTGTGMCGSTIISKNFVVTAGHCIVDDVTNQINTPENIYIGYGSSEYKKQTLVQATKLFLHPQYDISRFKNDIAIIQVPDLPVDGVNASTVPLYKGGLYPGMETTAIGWGLTNYTNITSQSPGIKEAVVRIGNTKLCKSHVKKYLNSTFDSSNGPRICLEASLSPGNGPCKGDSGGALLVNMHGKPYFAGVYSNGGAADGAYTCGQPGEFDFYTHTKNYVSFIHDVTGLWL